MLIQSENMGRNQVALRKEKLENAWSEFDQTQTTIEVGYVAESKGHIKYHEEFGDYYTSKR